MSHSILIIEDDETLADNIRVHLERNHWDAHVVHTAEDGLRKLETLRPDLVLTGGAVMGPGDDAVLVAPVRWPTP